MNQELNLLKKNQERFLQESQNAIHQLKNNYSEDCIIKVSEVIKMIEAQKKFLIGEVPEDELKKEIYLIVTDKELEKAFENTNFGMNPDKREILRNNLLKYASGYSSGKTIRMICSELGLITTKTTKRTADLTSKGKRYLFEAYANGLSL